MIARIFRRPGRPDVSLTLFAFAVLAICAFYGYVLVFRTPQPGFAFNTASDGWRVTSLDNCGDNISWCENQEKIRVGDLVSQIGELDFETFRNDWQRTPFGSTSPGDEILLIGERESVPFTVIWEMPEVLLAQRLARLGGTLLFVSFWVSGVVVLLFLQPRDSRWRLLVLFNFLTAIWISVGVVSGWQVAFSSPVLHIVTWMLFPVYLHLHLIVPSPLFPRRQRQLVLALYGSAFLLGTLELAGILPRQTYLLSFALAVSGSIVLLVYRAQSKSQASERPATNLMLTGIVLAFAPSALIAFGSSLLGNAPGPVALYLSLIVIPVLPLFYTYAVYKHRLGSLEFRANRLLGAYGFGVLMLAGFVVLFGAGSRLMSGMTSFSSMGTFLFSLVATLLFVAVSIAVRPHFQRWVNRVAYGARHDPDELFLVFAARIPGITERHALADLLTKEILPSLLIRESAFLIQVNSRAEQPLYWQSESGSGAALTHSELEQLADRTATYLPKPLTTSGRFAWVRLVMPIRIRQEQIGLWLFGRRDPDDYYPLYDIRLLEALANQIAPVLENIQLFEVVQRKLNEQSALLAASRAVSTSIEWPTLLERVTEVIGRLIDVTTVQITDWDETTETATVLAEYISPAAAEPEQLSILGKRFDLVGQFGDRLGQIRQGQALSFQAHGQSGSLNSGPHLGRLDNPTELVLPLLVKQNLLGLALLWDSRQDRHFTQEEIALGQAIAQQVALAIENARLYKETQERANELAILHQVALATSTVVEADDLLQQTTDMIVSRQSYSSFGFLLVDSGHRRLVAHSSFSGLPPNIGQLLLPLEGAGEKQVVRMDEPRIIQGVVQNDDLSGFLGLVPEMHSMVAVPVQVQGQVNSILCVLSPAEDAFGSNDVRFLTTLAGLVAAAIERAQLYNALQNDAARLSAQVDRQTAQLRQERDRTQAILDNAGEGIVFVSPNGVVQYANLAAKYLTGHATMEAMERPLWDWFGEELSEDTTGSLRSAVLAGESWSGELTGQRESGANYDVQATLVPIISVGDLLAGFVGVLSDITRLREIDRLRAEIMANLSHELRTPLTNIKTYTALLQRGRPESRTRHVEILKLEAERLSRLIDDLLDFSHQQQVEPRLQLVELSTLVEQTVEAFRAKAEGKGIDLQVASSAESSRVSGDAHQLSQVISNLVNNAIAYTPAGGCVSITTEVRSDNGHDLASIIVADTGIGIAENDIPYIFERFYRGRAAQNANIPGTGLGLAISHEIVEKHGGSIDVRSKGGTGSEFTIQLPLAK